MSQLHSFLGGEPPTDNVQLREWFEVRRVQLHRASVEMAINATELEARLRTVSGGKTVGGLTARKRARMVAMPIRLCAAALTIASKYMVTAYGRFEAAYLPELEASGAVRRRRPGFEFRANP